MAVAVILAAGRGSRMKGLTSDRPKCLLELAGRSLLHWQLDALRAAGLNRIIVVRGYRADMLTGDFETLDNPRWEQTNMVRTLACSFPALGDDDALVAYADIVYRPAHVRALLDAPGDLALTYDTNWFSLWSLRGDDPLADAETFRQQDGRLLEIGARPSALEEVHGQYMGLLKITPAGRERMAAYWNSLPAQEADRLDMTSLLRGLLAEGTDVRAVPVDGGWCECDTAEDVVRYEQALAGPGRWTHDWRERA